MLLKDKVAVIYGAGGAVGGATARAFAREGATVFLAGRTEAKLAAVAKDIAAAGGWAQVAPVDALDKGSVDRHAAEIVGKAGRIDISFNAIDLGDAQGAALVKIEEGHFALPIVTAIRTHFLTATAAARHMIPAGRGVILAITAQAGKTPFPDSAGSASLVLRSKGSAGSSRWRSGRAASASSVSAPPARRTRRGLTPRSTSTRPMPGCRARRSRQRSPSGPCSSACRALPRSPTPRRSSPRTVRGRSPRPSRTSPAGRSRTEGSGHK